MEFVVRNVEFVLHIAIVSLYRFVETRLRKELGYFHCSQSDVSKTFGEDCRVCITSLNTLFRNNILQRINYKQYVIIVTVKQINIQVGTIVD